MTNAENLRVLATGVPGLDEVLCGGFAEGKIFAIRGGPGTGKTTLSLQFLLEGIRNGEQCLYIGVGGAGESVSAVGMSHGWFLDPTYLALHEVHISEELITVPRRRAFHPSEVDLGETMTGILNALEKVQPKRVVIDTLAELRLLCEDDIEYRRQFLALRRALTRGNRTVLIADYGGDSISELHVEALAHGSIVLEAIPHAFGAERRRLRVVKYRAKEVKSGWHDFTIRTGGIELFPTLVARGPQEEHPQTVLQSGNEALDRLLGGGLNCGSATAIMGPSGCGKSTLCTQFITAAAESGEKVVIYLFDETVLSYLERAKGLGFDLRKHVEGGAVSLRQLNVSEVSPGEFVQTLMAQVKAGVTLIVIDSLNGYLSSMPDEKFLLIQLHELLTFLNQRGVTTFLTVVQHGLLEAGSEPSLDVSYLADNVLLPRFFEFRGEVRRAISVLKKRRGKHELTIREIRFSENGIEVSEPLHRMMGVLTGVPRIEQEHDVFPK